MNKTDRIAELEAEVARLRDENAKLVEAMLGMARMAAPAQPYVAPPPPQPWVQPWPFQPTVFKFGQPTNICAAN